MSPTGMGDGKKFLVTVGYTVHDSAPFVKSYTADEVLEKNDCIVLLTHHGRPECPPVSTRMIMRAATYHILVVNREEAAKDNDSEVCKDEEVCFSPK